MSDFVPGYELSNWFGLGMPSHTPSEIVDNAEVRRVYLGEHFRM